MSGEKYRVFSVCDMARIPKEALPRMLAELPALIESLRLPMEIREMAIAAGAVPSSEQEMFETLDWIDDDKGIVNGGISFMQEGEEVARTTFRQRIADLTPGASA